MVTTFKFDRICKSTEFDLSFRSWVFRKFPLRRYSLRFDVVVIYVSTSHHRVFAQFWIVNDVLSICSAIVTGC